MILKLALMLSMVLLTTSRCTEGCLRCTSDNKCLYCDVLQNYKLYEGRCIKKQTNNCVLVNDKNQCLKCKENFYLDQLNFQCVELFDKIIVENCAHHKAPKNCDVCKEGYVLQKNQCVQIQNPIQNCAIENVRAECEQCKPEYILSLDYKKCEAAPEINNCGTFSHVQCKSCKANYFFNENYYTDQVFGFSNSYQFRMLHRLRQDQENQVVDSHKFSRCQKKNVENCLIFENHQQCRKCKEGYFVNLQKQCEQIPAKSLPNCLKYSSAKTCTECTPGYFLKSDSECLKVIPIKNCMLYKNNVNFSSCARCTDNYYLSAENLCTRRTDISNIELCEKLSNEFEKCEICADGYRPTSDGFRCLPQIKNCDQYGFTNTNSYSHTCMKCQQGYFYNEKDKICIEGKIVFCEEYKHDEHKCVQCEQNFYLNSQKCEPHKKLPFCSDYSQTDKNLCSECEANSMLFNQTGFCQKVDRIPHCEEYENKTYCKRCRDGYFARTKTFCQLIPPHRNCLQLDNDNKNCVKCLKNFLIKDGDCVKPESYIVNGCEKWQNDGTGQLDNFQCEACKKNFVPVEFIDTFACKKISNMNKKQFKNSQLNLDQNCAQFQEENDKYSCVKCKKDFYLVDKTCAPNCYQNDKLTVYRQWVSIDNTDGDDKNESLKINRTNICEKTIPNCAVASLDITQDFNNISYVCEQCVSGFLPVTDKGNVTSHIVKELSIKQHMPLTSRPSVRCVDPKDFIVVGDTKDKKSVQNCQLYNEISKGVLGCQSCEFSYNGTVNQLIRQCKVYNQDETCKECNSMHYLKNARECVPVQMIENCLNYDGKVNKSQCEKCKDQFYVKDNQCVMRQNSLGKQNCTLVSNQDTCQCLSGFIQNPQKQQCEKLPDDCVQANYVNGVAQCNQCDDTKSYLVNGNCEKGIISNCNKYDQQTGKCNQCENGYFKDQNLATQCLSHDQNDSLCKVWSQTDKNKCDVCQPQSTLFNKVNECKQITNAIENCNEYANEFACKVCAKGYYLNNVSKTCLTIPEELQCEKLSVVEFANDGNTVDDYTVDNKFLHTCDQCKPGFFRILEQVEISKKSDPQNVNKFAVFRCKDWLSYMRLNCQESQIDGTKNVGKITCQGCKSEYFPYNLTNKLVCVERDYIKQRKNGFLQDPNCLAYEYGDNKMKCLECKYPKLLKSDNCVDSCSNGEVKYAYYIDSNNKYKKNVCVTQANTINGCEWYVPSEKDTTKTSNGFMCFKCSANHQKVWLAINAGSGTNNQQQFTVFNPFADQGQEMPQVPGQVFGEFSCVDFSNTTLRGLKNGTKNEIENCDLYTTFKDAGNNDIYGCFKCKFGYRGRVIKTAGDVGSHIQYCELFDDCETTIKGGLNYNTGFTAAKGPAENYMSCYACKNDKVLVSIFTAAASNLSLSQFKTDFTKDGTGKYEDIDDNTKVADPINSYNLRCVAAADLAAAHDATADVKKSKIMALKDANDSLVDNCAVMLIDASKNGYAADSVSCLACKPKFAPTFNTGVVTACALKKANAATDCASSNLLNTCSECVLKYANNALVFTAGIPDCVELKTTIKNCYAGYLDSNDGNAPKCQVCNKGYELGSDGKCYKQYLDSQGLRNFNFFDTFWNKINITGENWRYFTSLALNYGHQGEMECNKNQVLYKVTNQDDNLGLTTCITEKNDQDTYANTLNEYLNGANKNDYIITNCVRYGFIKDKNVCRECAANFILTLDHECLDSSDNTIAANLPNCLKAESKTSAVCVECKPNFRNVGGYCLDTQPNTAFDSKANKDYFVKNCKTYSDLTRLNFKGVCAQCDDGYYVKTLITPFNKCEPIPQSAGECKDFLDNTGCIQCKAGYGLVNIKDKENNPRRVCMKMKNDNNTNFLHEVNCESLVGIGDTNSLTNQKLQCAKCKSGFVLVPNVENHPRRCYSVVPPIDQCAKYHFAVNETKKIENSTFKCEECVNESTHYLDLVQNKCLARNVKDNCQQFDKFNDRCLQCQESFKKNIEGTQCTDLAVNTRNGYIQTCQKFQQCDKRKNYEGLQSQLNTLFTCHQCQDVNQIPFTVVNTVKDTNKKQLEVLTGLRHVVQNMQQWDNKNDKQSTQLVQCIKPEAASFKLKQNTALNLPQQCALAMIDISKQDNNDQTYDASESNKTTNPDLTKTGIRCVACKPKYKAVRANVTETVNQVQKQFQVDLLVTQCTEIANCESSTWFNACTQCKPGYTYNYNPQKGILYDECVSNSNNKYCLAIDNNTKQCQYCKKGAYMNKDGICELLNPEKCQFGQFRYRGQFEQKDLQKGIFHTNEIVGCNKCQEGYAPVLVTKPTKVCTLSMYHVQNSFVQETLYIQNCDAYGLDPLNGLTCKRCAKDFVLSSHHNRQCFSNAKIQNCEIAFSEEVCVKCNSDFVLVDSQCVVPSVNNCKEYGNNNKKQKCPLCTTQTQECVKCEEEYYLNGGKCVKGKVPNCEVLENENTCIECKDNYTLINMKGGSSYCYPNDPHFNCKEFDQEKFQSGILECKQCKDKSYVFSESRTDAIVNTCMPFTLTENCVNYQNNPIALADSQYTCNECNVNFYLENGECKQRTSMPDECLEYAIDKDQCVECQNGYYISADAKNCVAYPQGLYGCLTYQSKTVCTLCESKFVLRDEKCFEVTNEIQNCKYYQDQNNCLQCESGFVNVEGQCQKPFAVECATYRDTTNCETCLVNFHLELNDNGVTNCVANSIQNCIVYDELKPYGCLECTSDFYVQDGTCVSVGEKIEGCIAYKDAKVCKQCSSDYAMNYDGSACLKTPDVVSQIDMNCQESLLTEQPSCNTCKPGYYFVYGQCISCPQQIMEQGCYTCDPRRPQKCLMCQSGYIQSPEGDCVKPMIESFGYENGDSLDNLLTR